MGNSCACINSKYGQNDLSLLNDNNSYLIRKYIYIKITIS